MKIKLLSYEVSKGTIRPDPERLRPLQELPPPDNIKAQRRIIRMFTNYSFWILNYLLKIQELNNNTIFSISAKIKDSFEYLKRELEIAVEYTIDVKKTLEIETGASYMILAVKLNQGDQTYFILIHNSKPLWTKPHSSEERS